MSLGTGVVETVEVAGLPPQTTQQQPIVEVPVLACSTDDAAAADRVCCRTSADDEAASDREGCMTLSADDAAAADG